MHTTGFETTQKRATPSLVISETTGWLRERTVDRVDQPTGSTVPSQGQIDDRSTDRQRAEPFQLASLGWAMSEAE
jgi:hypothetical protein